MQERITNPIIKFGKEEGEIIEVFSQGGSIEQLRVSKKRIDILLDSIWNKYLLKNGQGEIKEKIVQRLNKIQPWKRKEKIERVISNFSSKELETLFHRLFWEGEKLIKMIQILRSLKKALSILVQDVEEFRAILLRREFVEMVRRKMFKDERAQFPSVKVRTSPKGKIFLGKYKRKNIAGSTRGLPGTVLTIRPVKFLKYYGWLFEAGGKLYYIKEQRREFQLTIFRESQPFKDYLFGSGERIPLLPVRKRLDKAGRFFLFSFNGGNKKERKVAARFSCCQEGEILEMIPVFRGEWILEFYRTINGELLRRYLLRKDPPYLLEIK